MLEILSSSYIFKNLFTYNFCLPVLASRTLREDTEEEVLKYFVIYSLMHIVCVCVCVCVCARALSHSVISDFLWSCGAYQAPLSMGFSRQEYWSKLLFPTPGDLPHPGIKPVSLVSPELSGRFFTTPPPGKPQCISCTLSNDSHA